MENTHKAFVVLAAAVTAGNFIGCDSSPPEILDAQASSDALDDTQSSAASPDAQAPADSSPSVTLVADASVPSRDTNPILSMPAGTLYDVLNRKDIS
jgi:hypothetical protein